MDRTERLLSMIASFLDAREPVSVSTIRGWFTADYGDVSDIAFERKFERDKAVLVDLGIPLRFVPGGDGNDDGYVVDRDETYLPTLDFDAEELASLYIAGNGLLTQSEFPYHRDLERAMDKLALGLQPDRIARARSAARRVLMNHPLQQRTPGLKKRLELASTAVADRQRLRMIYHTLYSGEVTRREVDPYGMRCLQGRWAIIGYCHRRQDVRVFSLHRMQELAVVDDAPPFDVPKGFTIAEWQTRPPWRYTMHEPILVTIECDPERAWLVEEQLGARTREVGDNWVAFEIDVTNADGFLECVLRQGPYVRVMAPRDLREQIVERLQAVVHSHAEARQ